jgi:hypothetical protein
MASREDAEHRYERRLALLETIVFSLLREIIRDDLPRQDFRLEEIFRRIQRKFDSPDKLTPSANLTAFIQSFSDDRYLGRSRLTNLELLFSIRTLN